MPRAVEVGAEQPDAPDVGAEQPDAPDVKPQHTQAMYGIRLRLPDVPLLRRTFHAIVAMFQAAHSCDFYITKYHAKPMEQLQNLLKNIALGLRRLEAEEQQEHVDAAATAATTAHRARRVTLRAAMAANRSSWCSCCELASFVLTGSTERRAHVPMRLFLSRPMFLLEECRRLLHRAHMQLIQAAEVPFAEVAPVDVLVFEWRPERKFAEEAADAGSDTEPGSEGSGSSSETERSGSALADQQPDAGGDAGPGSEGNEAPSEEQAIGGESAAHPAGEEGAAGSAAQPAEGGDTPGGAAQLPPAGSTPVGTVQPAEEEEARDDAAQLAEDGEGAEEDEMGFQALRETTSPHDDWLHRGPFLFDLDVHTYVRFVHRVDLADYRGQTDLQRADDVFAFDAHYALAGRYGQKLDRHTNRLVVMEALKCPSPELNCGEDNAAYKCVIGTLLRCPGPGRCADPLMFAPALFPVPGKRHDPQQYCCRQQWKARRAEIEVLAVQPNGFLCCRTQRC